MTQQDGSGIQSAQELDQQEVLELLRVAVNKSRSLASVKPLCKLRAAAKVSVPYILGLIDDVHYEVRGLRVAAKQQRTADFNRIARKVEMSSTARSTHVDAARHMESPRKQLGLQAVAALQDLQDTVTARMTGRRLMY
jgi:4-hydroxy-3-methylbut-2-en-1-yl diphosphate synthase IspG/GcpE